MDTVANAIDFFTNKIEVAPKLRKNVTAHSIDLNKTNKLFYTRNLQMKPAIETDSGERPVPYLDMIGDSSKYIGLEYNVRIHQILSNC